MLKKNVHNDLLLPRHWIPFLLVTLIVYWFGFQEQKPYAPSL